MFSGITHEARAALVSLSLIVLITALFGTMYAGNAGVSLYGTPRQPIDFFHRVHAGDKGIACEFCHRTVGTADFAGMPPTETCMRCHRVVIPGHWEIQRLHDYWDRRAPVPWVRVNDLPGFVYFSHEAHVRRGVKCAICHGPVVTMDRLYQTAPLTMGWCVRCHRQNRAPQSCWTCHR